MSSLSIPAAIIIGLTAAGAMSGVGLYFGLRARAAPMPESTTATTAATAAATPDTTPPAPVAAPNTPTPPADPQADRARARSEVVESFDAQHATLVKECWEPSVAKSKDPPNVSMTYDLTYDASGHVLVRSVLEDHTKARLDVTKCVVRLLQPPSITPSGAQVRLRVPLALP